jgi:hypothetical protein
MNLSVIWSAFNQREAGLFGNPQSCRAPAKSECLPPLLFAYPWIGA